MFCDEFLNSVEAIAADDLTPDARVMAHLATCPGCTAALKDARRVEQLLRARPVPQPPPQFTTRIIGRIRGERWRREQFVDAGFNLIVAVVAIGVLGALWFVVSQSGLGSVVGDIFNVLNSATLGFIERVAPSLPLYLGAVALLATALGVWWWAERDVHI